MEFQLQEAQQSVVTKDVPRDYTGGSLVPMEVNCLPL